MAPATMTTSVQLPTPTHRHATCRPPCHRPRQSTATQRDHVTEDDHLDSITHCHINGDNNVPCHPDGDNGMRRHCLWVSFIAHHPLLCSSTKHSNPTATTSPRTTIRIPSPMAMSMVMTMSHVLQMVTMGHVVQMVMMVCIVTIYG